ncbi:MAG: FG-GAP-like repeat-containing protein, partial [Lentisphaeria bacterium]|nr:FG-GAP-like repeat-containing protein [Lentisphaeria bacterium]
MWRANSFWRIAMCVLCLLLACALATPALLAQERLTGVLDLSEAEKAQVLAGFVEWAPPMGATRAVLPDKVMNLAHLPTVNSQGQLGICGSFAVYYYLKTYYEAKAKGWGGRPNPATTPERVFSPAWGVLSAPHGTKGTDLGSEPEGASPLRAIETISASGALTWAEMPYSDDASVASEDKFYRQLPSVAQMKQALRYKGQPGVILNNINTQNGLQALKQFLADGNIAVAIWNSPLTVNFDSYPDASSHVEVGGEQIGDVNNGVYAWPSDEGGRAPSHAVNIVGYDDTKSYRNRAGEERQGALLIVNSWGTNWGLSPAAGVERGFMWLGYDAVLEYGKLGSQVYALGARAELYQPELLGTIRLEDNTGENWLTAIMGYKAYWPGLLNFSTNGRPLAMRISGNRYITKSNTDVATTMDYVLDLSAMAAEPFPSLGLQAGMATDDVLGKIVGLNLERFAGGGSTEWPVPDVDLTVKRFSSSYPTFTGSIGIMQQRVDSGLEALHPQSGSAVWGDADGDGFADLALSIIQKDTATGTLEVLHRLYHNDGQGRFNSYTALPVPAGESEVLREALCALAWADMNNDGLLDLVMGNGNGCYVLLNNGDGAFALSQTIDHAVKPDSLALGDFDHDGRVDIAFANGDGTGILRQTAAGGFVYYAVSARYVRDSGFGIASSAMVCGDVNGDGLMDLVASGMASSAGYPALIWYENLGGMQFQPRQLPLPGLRNFAVDLADYDGDGCDDILYSAGSNNGTHVMGVFRGKSDGLPEPVVMPSGLPGLWGGRVLWADLDGDGAPEALISGVDNDGLNYTTPGQDFSYGDLSRFPMPDAYGNYLYAFRWDESNGQFSESGLSLPGTVGFAGPAILAAVDVDGDSDTDVWAAGVRTTVSNVFAAQGPGQDVCGGYFYENRAKGFLGNDELNAAPTAPTGLTAEVLGSGEVRLSWTAASDAETPALGLRYILQLGTSSGAGDLCSGVLPLHGRGLLKQPGVVMTQLPARVLFWRVRAVDATGRLSPWSTEATVTSQGQGVVPAPGAPLAEQGLPQATISVTGRDTQDSTAGGYAYGSGYISASGGTFVSEATYGDYVVLLATPRAGWRFSHWEGPVQSPLSRNTKMLVTGDMAITARFIPDDSVLRTAATHSAMRDRAGLVWAWGDEEASAVKVGDAWHRGVDGMAALAAASNAYCLELATSATYYGERYGYANSSDDNGKNFMRDSLMAVRNLAGVSWWPWPAYPEKSIGFWAGGDGYVASHLGTYAQEWNSLSFGGTASSLYPYTTWTVSQHDPNVVNRGVAQVAVGELTVLILGHQGELYAIGDNLSGQIGDGSTTNYTDIALVPGTLRFKAIALGEDRALGSAFALGVDFQGRVWSWGSNASGQLGTGSYDQQSLQPQLVAGIASPVRAIAVGASHALAVTEDGLLYAWGANANGQVGTGDADGDGVLDDLVVRAPQQLPGFTNVTSIAAAKNHSLALTADDELYGWGDNGVGQLDGVPGDDRWTPQLIVNAPKRSNGAAALTMAVRAASDAPGEVSDYPGMGAVSPPAGNYQARLGATLAIAAIDGERYAFDHWEGPVAEPTARETTVLVAEATTVTAVFVSSVNDLTLTMAVTPEGAGTTSPAPGVHTRTAGQMVGVAAIPAFQYGFVEWESASDLGGHAGAAAFDLLMSNDTLLTACFASRPFTTTAKLAVDGGSTNLNADGTVSWTVREQYFNGSYTTYRYVTYRDTLGGIGVRAVDVVGDCLALGNDGRLYTWGRNTVGQYGIGTVSNENRTPNQCVTVLGPDSREAFTDAVAIYSVGTTRFARRANGRLYYWGETPVTGVKQSRPIEVPGLREDAVVVDIALATSNENIGGFWGTTVTHSTYLFLYDDGSVDAWGHRIFTGSGEDHVQPRSVPGLAGITAIQGGSNVALALRDDGKVLVWGRNDPNYTYTGELGLGENILEQVVPTPIPGLPVIVRIFIMSHSCYAVGSDGQLWVWGNNGGNMAALGLTEPPDDPPTAVFSPLAHPTAPEDIVRMSGYSSNTTAITVAGAVWNWGANANFSQRWPVENTAAGIVDLTPPAHCRLTLVVDDRAESLLSLAAGIKVYMAGDWLQIMASSTAESRFSGWYLNGVLHSRNAYLEYEITGDVVLEARYDITPPVVTLPTATVAAGTTVSLPLLLTQAITAYEGVDLLVTFPDELQFQGVDGLDTQLSEDGVLTYWAAPEFAETAGPAAGRSAVRVTARERTALFSVSDVPLLNLRFQLPLTAQGSYEIGISGIRGGAGLSRNLGLAVDVAAATTSVLTVDTEAQVFMPGWMCYTPFGEGPATIAALLDTLTMAGATVSIGELGWYWDSAAGVWRATRDLLPNRPLWLYVENSGAAVLDLAPLPYGSTLRRGWNMLSVPTATPVPAGALALCRLGRYAYVQESSGELLPGRTYWLLWG